MGVKRVLVVSSTFPATDTDPVPAFVRDQIIAMKKVSPELEFSVLAPHDKRSNTISFSQHDSYNEYRFHYMWPTRLEKLAGRGIMPTLKQNPFYYGVVPFLFLCEFTALLKLTRKLHPDVIYAHWFTPQAIAARYVGRITGTPFVFTTHASDVAVWKKIPMIGGSIVRSTTTKAAAFTAVSQRSMEKLKYFFTDIQWRALKDKSAIIPMGVNLPTITEDSRQSDPNKIIFVGRLAEKKGVQYLLPAFAAIRKKFPRAKLTIAGDGPWLDQLKKQAAELKLTDIVDFPGYVTGAVKQQLIESAAIYTVPSIIASDGDAEGLPVSLMEGLAYGKICIATNESGADNILTNGKDGFLLPQKDIELLSQALSKALSLTAQERTEMRLQAQKTAAQFSWKKVARDHVNLFFKERTS